jgi:hypothetical protein
MTLICPTDVVDAPIEVVWGLLTDDPARWDSFYDLRIRRVEPPGPARVGQRIIAESGPPFLHLAVLFTLTRIDPEEHRLGFDGRLPLGITVSEDMRISRIDEGHCRVSYGCDFAFPEGWRGTLVKTVLARELVAGPADSLARLKRAAEAAYARVHGVAA